MKKKICFKCGLLLPLNQYYKHSQMKDGHLNKCIMCTKKDVSDHRQANIEKVRAYDRERGRTEHRKEANRMRSRNMTPEQRERSNMAKHAWNERNKNKRAASILVNNCLANGRLVKGPCAVCGATENIHGHHDDYCKPLEVVWLCAKHHKEQHLQYERGHEEANHHSKG